MEPIPKVIKCTFTKEDIEDHVITYMDTDAMYHDFKKTREHDEYFSMYKNCFENGTPINTREDYIGVKIFDIEKYLTRIKKIPKKLKYIGSLFVLEECYEIILSEDKTNQKYIDELKLVEKDIEDDVDKHYPNETINTLRDNFKNTDTYTIRLPHYMRFIRHEIAEYKKDFTLSKSFIPQTLADIHTRFSNFNFHLECLYFLRECHENALMKDKGNQKYIDQLELIEKDIIKHVQGWNRKSNR